MRPLLTPMPFLVLCLTRRVVSFRFCRPKAAGHADTYSFSCCSTLDSVYRVDSLVPRLRVTAGDGSPDLWCAQRTPGRSAPFLRRMLPGRPKSRPPSYTGRGCNGPPPSDRVRGLHLATWHDVPTRTGYAKPRVNQALSNQKNRRHYTTTRHQHSHHKEKSINRKTVTKLHMLHVALTSFIFFFALFGVSCCRAERCSA